MSYKMDHRRCVTEGQLGALVELAKKEDWRLLDYKKNEKYWVLRRYLKGTFERLSYESEDLNRHRKLKYDSMRRDAIINTGLVDEHFNEIYARANVAHVNDQGMRYYRFNTFFVNRRSRLTQSLIYHFHLKAKKGIIDKGELPLKASYFEPNQLFFNPSYAFQFGAYPHVIRDRLYRFPLPFVRSLVNDEVVANDLMDSLLKAKRAEEAYDYSERELVVKNEIWPLLDRGNGVLYQKIDNYLDDAVRVAVKNASYNFTTAMLGYYPKNHDVNFYLPICLMEDGKPDFALLVQRDSKNKLYVPTTIFTLDDAYACMRLVRPMNDNWLFTAAQDVRQINKERRYSALTAVVRNEDDADARAKLRITDSQEVVRTVQTGFTIGRKYGTEFIADIALDTSHEHISRHQGDFNCHGGIWKFIPHGLNPTSVIRIGEDGGEPETHHLINEMPFVLHDGDQLVFGKSDPTIIFMLDSDDEASS